MQVLFDKVMSDSRPEPDRCFSITRRIPGERQPRIDIPVVAFDARFAFEAGVAWISEARWSIGNHHASLVGIKSGQAEIIEISLGKRHWEERLPANAVGHRQFSSEFPRVLAINPKEVLIQVQWIRIGLPQLRYVTKEKIRHTQACERAIDRIGSTRPRLSNRPLNRAHVMSAEGELMRSLDDTQIVIGPDRRSVGKRILAEITASQRKRAIHRYGQVLWLIRESVDTDVPGTKHRGARFLGPDAIAR